MVCSFNFKKIPKNNSCDITTNGHRDDCDTKKIRLINAVQKWKLSQCFWKQINESFFFLQIFLVQFALQLLFRDSVWCNAEDGPSLHWENQTGCQTWYRSHRMRLISRGRRKMICSKARYCTNTAATSPLFAPTQLKLYKLGYLWKKGPLSQAQAWIKGKQRTSLPKGNNFLWSFSKEAARIYAHLNLQLNSFIWYAGKLPFGNLTLKVFFPVTAEEG